MLPSTNGTARSPSNADARPRARTQREAVTPVDGERTAAAARRPPRTTRTSKAAAATSIITIRTTIITIRTALLPRLRREEVTARAEADGTGEVIAGKWKCPASAASEREKITT